MHSNNAMLVLILVLIVVFILLKFIVVIFLEPFFLYVMKNETKLEISDILLFGTQPGVVALGSTLAMLV